MREVTQASGEVRRVGGGLEGRSILTLCYCVSVKMSFTLRELWGEGKREFGSSVADPDPGSGAYSGIRNRFFSDPSSRISGPGTTPATGAIFFWT